MPTATLAVATQQVQARQNVATSVVRQAAQQDQAIAQIIDEAARSAPTNQARGGNIDILV